VYKKFFGIKERPFSKTPDPRFLFFSRGHREALARLQYAVEERDLVLLTGEIGCGKTTLSRALIDELGEQYKVVLLINPRLSPLEFLRAVAHRLEVKEPARSKTDLLEQLGERLYSLFQQSICPVLIIDEAQLIPSKETFDEIRLLTNFQLDDQNLLSVVLMGQPELRKRLAHRAYEPLRQRIGLSYDLLPLNVEETGEYLEFRWHVAGGSGNLFTQEAIQEIYNYSGGIPRKINHAAALAILEGFGRETRTVDEQVIRSILPELALTS